MESARLPGGTHVRGTHIVWDRTQTVLELPVLGYFRTYEKRTERARPNPWRRHGALLKIHEIGGWVSKLEKQPVSRRNRKYYYVKPGTKTCNAPTRPPITIRESKFLPPSVINVGESEIGNVEDLAYSAAVQIQYAIQAALIDSQQTSASKKIGGPKLDDVNDVFSTGKVDGVTITRSSSLQRLPGRSSNLPPVNPTRSRSVSILGRKRR